MDISKLKTSSWKECGWVVMWYYVQIPAGPLSTARPYGIMITVTTTTVFMEFGQCARPRSKNFSNTNSFNSYTVKLAIIITLILQRKKLRPKSVKSLPNVSQLAGGMTGICTRQHPWELPLVPTTPQPLSDGRRLTFQNWNLVTSVYY